jgi:hypothetical protein
MPAILLLIYLINLLSFFHVLSFLEEYARNVTCYLRSDFHLIHGDYRCRIRIIIPGTPCFTVITFTDTGGGAGGGSEWPQDVNPISMNKKTNVL